MFSISNNISGGNGGVAPDLDYGVISGRSPVVASAGFYPGGVRVKAPHVSQSVPAGRPTRGVICGFSRDSRTRLIDEMMPVDWALFPQGKRAKSSRGFFTTLTARDWSPDRTEWKRLLFAFRRRLFRAWPVMGVIWRLEFQERGAPHFHLVVIFKSPVSYFDYSRWVRSAWQGVLGIDLAITAVDSIWRGRGLMAYVSKYMAKTQVTERETGRVWGVWGLLPKAVLAVVVFSSPAALVEFQRRVRRWGRQSRFLRRWGGRRVQEGRVFGDGSLLLQLIRGLVVDLAPKEMFS